MKPILRLLTVKKASHNEKKPKKKPVKIERMPRLTKIGNSVGVIISKTLLESIGWKKGDVVEYEYDDSERTLVVRNLSSEQRDYDAIHKKD